MLSVGKHTPNPQELNTFTQAYHSCELPPAIDTHTRAELSDQEYTTIWKIESWINKHIASNLGQLPEYLRIDTTPFRIEVRVSSQIHKMSNEAGMETIFATEGLGRRFIVIPRTCLQIWEKKPDDPAWQEPTIALTAMSNEERESLTTRYLAGELTDERTINLLARSAHVYRKWVNKLPDRIAPLQTTIQSLSQEEFNEKSTLGKMSALSSASSKRECKSILLHESGHLYYRDSYVSPLVTFLSALKPPRQLLMVLSPAALAALSWVYFSRIQSMSACAESVSQWISGYRIEAAIEGCTLEDPSWIKITVGILVGSLPAIGGLVSSWIHKFPEIKKSLEYKADLFAYELGRKFAPDVTKFFKGVAVQSLIEERTTDESLKKLDSSLRARETARHRNLIENPKHRLFNGLFRLFQVIYRVSRNWENFICKKFEIPEGIQVMRRNNLLVQGEWHFTPHLEPVSRWKRWKCLTKSIDWNNYCQLIRDNFLKKQKQERIANRQDIELYAYSYRFALDTLLLCKAVRLKDVGHAEYHQ